jgi:hemoglobin
LKISNIKGLFPPTEKGFEAAKKHSADFFIQLMGGPEYFNESRGNPMMRRRHAPFKITPDARIVWLECYIEALNKLDAPDSIKKSYWDYVNTFSTWMVNTV